MRFWFLAAVLLLCLAQSTAHVDYSPTESAAVCLVELSPFPETFHPMCIQDVEGIHRRLDYVEEPLVELNDSAAEDVKELVANLREEIKDVKELLQDKNNIILANRQKQLDQEPVVLAAEELVADLPDVDVIPSLTSFTNSILSKHEEEKTQQNETMNSQTSGSSVGGGVAPAVAAGADGAASVRTNATMAEQAQEVGGSSQAAPARATGVAGSAAEDSVPTVVTATGDDPGFETPGATGTVPAAGSPLDSSLSATQDSVDPAGEGASTEEVAAPAEELDPEYDAAFHSTRFNFGSAASGAKMLSNSPNMQKASTILAGNADTYMLTPCDEDTKWFIIQLSEEIIIDTILLSNLEHYSGSFKDFEVWGSSSYPGDAWSLLGTFTVDNTLTEELFHLEASKDGWRYVKVRLLNYYSSEYYCTITSLEIYGTTMLDSLREEMRDSFEEVQDVYNILQGGAAEEVSVSEEQEVEIISPSGNTVDESGSADGVVGRVDGGPDDGAEVAAAAHNSGVRTDIDVVEDSAAADNETVADVVAAAATVDPAEEDGGAVVEPVETETSSLLSQIIDRVTGSSGAETTPEAPSEEGSSPGGEPVGEKDAATAQGAAKTVGDDAPVPVEVVTTTLPGGIMEPPERVVERAVPPTLQQPVSSGGKQSNIFKQLSDRLKQLEINQAFMSQYVETVMSQELGVLQNSVNFMEREFNMSTQRLAVASSTILDNFVKETEMMKQTALFLDAQMQNYSSWLTTQQELQTQQQLLFEAQAAHFQELVTEEVAILRNYIFIVDTIVKLSVIIVIVVGCLFVLNIVRKSCERALN